MKLKVTRFLKLSIIYMFQKYFYGGGLVEFKVELMKRHPKNNENNKF